MAPSKRVERILGEEAGAFEAERHKPSKNPVGRPRLPDGEVAQVYSVRIPVERIEELRIRASQEGRPPSSLIRRWVLERLDEARPTEKSRHLRPARRTDKVTKSRRT